MKLDIIRMHDGSRHFATSPQSESWHSLRDHLATLEGALVTGFITAGVAEAWLDFEFADHRFSINNQFGEYWFFVENASCDDAILTQVATHGLRLLGA